jgi:hypothetical protein
VEEVVELLLKVEEAVQAVIVSVLLCQLVLVTLTKLQSEQVVLLDRAQVLKAQAMLEMFLLSIRVV